MFTCLPSLEALRAVVLGNDGLRAGKAIESYVDFSTTGSAFARDVAVELKHARHHDARRADYRKCNDGR